MGILAAEFCPLQSGSAAAVRLSARLGSARLGAVGQSKAASAAARDHDLAVRLRRAAAGQWPLCRAVGD